MLQEIYLPSIKTEKKDGHKAVFSIEPLSQGFGYTLGNSLRRVLLSSLVGTAPVGVRIKGVSHEFSTISGVKEDVVEIILNLKQLRAKLNSEEPQTVKINAKGPKKITAADIEAPSQVEIINKDLYLATLDDKAELSMEIDIDKGRGYEVTEKRKEELKANTIELDAMYSPVKRVKFDVEATRSGKVIDLDKLVLEVETDGIISPEDAIKEAAEVLVEQFSLLSGKKEAPKKEISEPKENKKKPSADSIQIEELDLSARAMNAFLANDIKTVGEAQAIGSETLSKMKGLGKKAIEELNEKIRDFNLEL